MRRTLRTRLAALALIASSTAVLGHPGTATAAGCPSWTKTQVAKGYSVLENLAFDGQGAMLLSESSLGGTPSRSRCSEVGSTW